MVVKVKDGTRGTKSLCETCRNSHIIKGTSESQVITRCAVQETGNVPFTVVDCNNYSNKAETSIWDMREIAWVLSTDKQKKFGFKSPKEWKAQKMDDGLDDQNLSVPERR